MSPMMSLRPFPIPTPVIPLCISWLPVRVFSPAPRCFVNGIFRYSLSTIRDDFGHDLDDDFGALDTVSDFVMFFDLDLSPISFNDARLPNLRYRHGSRAHYRST